MEGKFKFISNRIFADFSVWAYLGGIYWVGKKGTVGLIFAILGLIVLGFNSWQYVITYTDLIDEKKHCKVFGKYTLAVAIGIDVVMLLFLCLYCTNMFF